MKFTDLGLSEQIVDTVVEQGYTAPSPIQAKSIPVILQGRDILAAAQTGTGKTAGFTLPMLQLTHQRKENGDQRKNNQVWSLVITPTRELAAQILDSVRTYGQSMSLRTEVVFGGVKINPQMQRLTSGVDILIATPGRLLDLHQQNAIKFDHLQMLVLDEADRMLDMGFINDVRKIIRLLPKKRQTLLFSATFSQEIKALAKDIVHDAVEVSVTPPNSTVNAIKQWLVPCEKASKSALLTHLINEKDWHQVLVFMRTKHSADRLVRQLTKRGIESVAIHGNKSQGARTRALASFKEDKVRVLVATDIAARGIDIEQLPHVVNFDLPSVPEDYVHRIGRTGRAGAEGEAVSLVSHDEIKQLNDIERLIKKEIERQFVDGFEPENNLPESKKDFSAVKRKPKKNKSSGKKRAGGGQSNKNKNGVSNKKPRRQQSDIESNKRRSNSARNKTNPGKKKQANKKPFKRAPSSTNNAK